MGAGSSTERAMPHIILEYSANLEDSLDVRAFVDDLHATAIASGLFEPPGLRTRVERREIYRIADGRPDNAFVHITTRVRHGRTAETRKQMGETLMRVAERRLAALLDRHPIIYAVEVHEIDPEFRWHRNTIRERAGQAAE
jgi:5-carboxymethyl-2-hydroxymuconate isomerase